MNQFLQIKEFVKKNATSEKYNKASYNEVKCARVSSYMATVFPEPPI